ncbi:aldo/keto reductase [Secundilactobacillus odoratitofui]|nr:aldo/keto reductase [Secundilactobacillus odoratitofui]
MSVLTDTITLNNDVKIPAIGFGTWQTPNGPIAYKAVKTALDLGYRHIDTAYAYHNEESVGKAIKDSGLKREEVFITSKLPGEVKNAKQVTEYFESTINSLGVDYLDLYLIHAPWPWNKIGERHDADNVAVWREIEKLYQAGKIKSIGVSNFDVHDLQNLLKHTDIVPVVNQIQYYVGFTEPKIVQFATEHHIKIEAYSPLATGDLIHNAKVKAIADHYNVSVPQVALKFVLQNGAIVLPKATSEAHIKANADLDFTISEADMATLNAMTDTAPAHFHNETQG